MIGLGTLANVVAILAGGGLGLLLKGGLPERWQGALMRTMGLAVVFIGAAGALPGLLRAEGGALAGTGVKDTLGMIFALALGTLLTTVAIILYRCDKLNKVSLLAVIFAFASLECLAIECLHTLALDGGVHFSWSPFAVAPCLFISLALFFINGNRSVREEVRRRVHF